MELALATLVLLAGNEVAQGRGGFSEESEYDDHLLCGLCPERETRSKSRAFWASRNLHSLYHSEIRGSTNYDSCQRSYSEIIGDSIH